MLKIIIVIALIAGIAYWLRGVISKGVKGMRQDPSLEGDEMIECDLCGTYVSVREVMKAQGKNFCSQECLRQRT